MAVMFKATEKTIWPIKSPFETSRYSPNPETHNCMDCDARPVTHIRLSPSGLGCENHFVGFLCADCADAQKKARRNRRLAHGRAAERGEFRHCDHCGETYEPKRTDARYCSQACRQRAYRQRT